LPRLQGFVFVIRQHENEDDCGALVEWYTKRKPDYLNKGRLHRHLLQHKSHVDINIYYTSHNQHRPRYKEKSFNDL
jgi:hypothetical protein